MNVLDRPGAADSCSQKGTCMFTRIALLAATAAICLPSPAAAWGQLGHRVIGELADERISGRTRAEIELILGEEGLAESSTWADEQRSNPAEFWQEEAGPYHYVTVPEGLMYDDIGPPEEGDALSALARFAEIVRNPSATQDEKALALRFIIHIVGDVHQPLHAGNGEDRGGNDVRALWFGDETNLHSVWDSLMIDGQNLSFTEYTARLGGQIGPETQSIGGMPNRKFGLAKARRYATRSIRHPQIKCHGWVTHISFSISRLPSFDCSREAFGWQPILIGCSLKSKCPRTRTEPSVFSKPSRRF